jgi:hypothetical protein
MQQAPQPRPYGLISTFRPQQGGDHVARYWTFRFGQIDQQREAFAQRQLRRLIVAANLRKSKRPQAQHSHCNAIRGDGALTTLWGDAQGTRRC